MKKITSFILAFLMVAAMTAGTGITAKADAFSVTKSPIPSVVDTMKVSDLVQLIKDGNGTLTSNGAPANITPEMCYLYGANLGLKNKDTTINDYYGNPVLQDGIGVFPFKDYPTQVDPGTLSVAELATKKYLNSLSPNWNGSDYYLVDGNYSLVIRYNNGTETIRFTVSEVTGIQWPDKLTKTSYFVGDSFDFTGDYVTLVHKNGAKTPVPVTANMMYEIAAVKQPGVGPTAGGQASVNARDGIGAWFVHAYTLGNQFSLPTAAATEYDLVIRYNQAYDIDGKAYVSHDVAKVKEGSEIAMARYNTHRYIDSSFEAGYWLAGDGRVVKENMTAGDTWADWAGDLKAPYKEANHKVSPISLNGTKTYHITVTNPGSYAPKLRYRAHVQNIGWQGWFYAPNEAGTDHQSLRMEALKVQIENLNKSMGGIEYMGHVQNIGDTEWVTGDAMVGTEGQSKRLEGVAIRFTGKYADAYSVNYRVHVQGIGWMAWMKDGEYAGTKTEGKRMEAIEIQVTAK